VIRDAARFVPEIADLAGQVVAPSWEAVAAETARVLAQILSMDPPEPKPPSAEIIEAVIIEPDGTRAVYRRE
jgi:hypothetical protein